MRMRNKERTGKAGRIFLDNKNLKQNLPSLNDNSEIAVQAIPFPENVGPQDRPLFVQQYHPKTGKLDDVQYELIVRKNATIGQFKEIINKLFKIEISNIGIAKAALVQKQTAAQISKLDFKSKMNDIDMMKAPPLNVHDGALIYIKDLSILGSEKSTDNSTTSKFDKTKKTKGSSSVHSKNRPEGSGLKIYTQSDIEQQELDRVIAESLRMDKEKKEKDAKAALASSTSSQK